MSSELMKPTLFTIGHSNHALERFLSLLRMHTVTAVADVRSQPHSRFNPQFNQEPLRVALGRSGLHYVFLGEELGARRIETECYVDGKAKYELIARIPAFAEGLGRLIRGVKRHRIALMCAEKDPLTCHRTILICKHLREEPIDILHILDDGSLETMEAGEGRLLQLTGIPRNNLFRTRDELVQQAYAIQADKIAYTSEATSDRL